MPPWSCDPPDRRADDADGWAGVRAPHDDASLSVALRTTLEEFGVASPAPSAAHDCGRLAALEFASALGIREARRALAREREPLLRQCFPDADPLGRSPIER